MDFFDKRNEYLKKTLELSDLKKDPFKQFSIWIDEASQKIKEPNAMCLATCNKAGQPSSRMVLLKKWDSKGFVFFTNLQSRKSRELEENPFASATLFWNELERQICFQGKVIRVSEQEADLYFSKRPRKSQLSAWASKQGELLSSRDELEQRYYDYEKEYEEKKVPRPSFWGGYCIIPDSIEFWQGRESRLHDRFRYALKGKEWSLERLYP